MFKICVCGGGHIGHTVAAIAGRNPSVSVSLLTRRPHEFASAIDVQYRDTFYFGGELSRVTDDPQEAVRDADLVILTVPAFARARILENIAPFVRADTWVASIPANGGFSWQAAQALKRTTYLFGFQRTPWVSRVKISGGVVNVMGVRDRVVVSGYPKKPLAKLAAQLSSLLGFEIQLSDTPLCIPLGLANPTFHSARLYSLFSESLECEQPSYFYAQWDDKASHTLLKLDDELLAVRQALNVRDAVTVKAHFGIETCQELTRAIRSINTLHSIKSPLVFDGGCWRADTRSRFFEEDLSYGLLVQKAIAEIAGVDTPTIDKVLTWDYTARKQQYFSKGKLCLKCCHALPIPQNFGLHTKEQLLNPNPLFSDQVTHDANTAFS